MRWKLLSMIFVFVGLIAAVPASQPAHADALASPNEQGEVVITLALQDFMRGFPIEEILDQFEAQNPGVRVEPVYVSFDSFFLPLASDDIESHLSIAHEVAQIADVILANSNSLSPEMTRAGYVLDLAPLASSDTTLNPADFIPAAWDAFRWDNGLWALPVKVEPSMLVYDPALFDAAGVAYPNANWTMDDLANAARALTQRNAAGEVTTPGLITTGSETALLRSLYRQSLSDNTASPSVPRFNTPELIALVEQWAALVEEGVVSSFLNGENMVTAEIPMQIAGSFALFAPPMEQDQPPRQRAVSALPGGAIVLETSGFAVSSGTTQPQAAYALAKFLTGNGQIQNILQGTRPARTNVTPEQVEMTGGFAMAMSMPMSPEVAAQVEALIPLALPPSEFRFDSYLRRAIDEVVEGRSDAAAALQNAELLAVGSLQTASDQRGTAPILVATAVPDVVLAPGEIALKFGAGFTAQTGEWERLMREFAAIDPQVGEVVLDLNFGSASEYASRNDCFYLNYNAVPSIDLSLLLPIDPFLSADPNFSTGDVAGNALAQLQRDTRTWAFPFTISPTMLNYHRDLFERAGVPQPTNGWTVSAFVDALRALDAAIPADQHVFNNRGFGDTYLLMLIAAYGGLPLDYRTNPPTIQFTDPAAVEAIRQVLDLAKADLISYSELAANMVSISIGEGDNPDPIFSEIVAGAGMMMLGGTIDITTENPYSQTTYPSGAYTATAYEIGAGYVSASSQNPDACYRLFKFLASHPELFDGMPALRSQFNNPALLASEGADAANFYNQYDAVMQDPNAIVIPSSFSGDIATMGMNAIRRWLDKAFDEYVLRDADLLTALTEAQTKAEAFQACAAVLPPYNNAAPDDYLNGVRDCALSVDPDASMFFPMRAAAN